MESTSSGRSRRCARRTTSTCVESTRPRCFGAVGARTTSTCVESTIALVLPDHVDRRTTSTCVESTDVEVTAETIGRRTTSTCVESTSGLTGSCPTDHLHVRGEHCSGRSRGQLTTSTCVESTPAPSAATPGIADHLHVRGEHWLEGASPDSAIGPPPRAWRARRCPTAIPRRTDHLHVRGEHRRSPVHVRGEHVARWCHATTSTCVESTPCPCSRAWRAALRDRATDHLHVRGEHFHLASASPANGPPPRAWRAQPRSMALPYGPPPRAWRAPFVTCDFSSSFARFCRVSSKGWGASAQFCRCGSLPCRHERSGTVFVQV